jgi:hypothetical protein
VCSPSPCERWFKSVVLRRESAVGVNDDADYSITLCWCLVIVGRRCLGGVGEVFGPCWLWR